MDLGPLLPLGPDFSPNDRDRFLKSMAQYRLIQVAKKITFPLIKAGLRVMNDVQYA
jgi:hypothetical protein